MKQLNNRLDFDEETSQLIHSYVFQTLHDYFNQKNTRHIESVVTGKKWVATPKIDMTINGVELGVVCCVEDTKIGKGEIAPIHFFVGYCDGILLGKLENQLESILPDGSWKIDVTGNGTNGKFDFDKVTAEELNQFMDSLHSELLMNPKPSKNRIPKFARNVREKAKPNFAKRVRSSPGHSSYNVKRTKENFALAGSIAKLMFPVSGLIVGSIIGDFLFDKDSTGANRPEDAVSLTLPASSTIDPNKQEWSEVEIADDSAIAKLGDVDSIGGLDSISTDDIDNPAHFEDDVEDPNKVVGNNYQMPVPEVDECLVVNTFGIPNGSVQMLRSANVPSLHIRITHKDDVMIGKNPDAFNEKFKLDLTKAEKIQDADLTSAEVCNYGEPGRDQSHLSDESLYLKFVDAIPVGAKLSVGD